MHTTLNQEISAIISLYNHSTFYDHIDRSKFHVLRGILKSISQEKDRQSKPTNPLRNLLLLKIVKLNYKKFNYHNLLYKTLFCFAKGFALRTGEYLPKTQRPTERTITWNDLKFKTINKKKFLSLTIRISKTNKNWKEEIITRQCLCANKCLKPICAVCIMKQFKKLYKLKFGMHKNAFVFRRPDGKLLRSGDWCEEFKRALIFAGVKNVKYPYWRPHSLRHGELSDLYAIGTPMERIRKYARHVPKSKVTFTYIQVETELEAAQVAKSYIKYFKKSRML